ncbi:MAG: hypothetical protein HY423_00015 [Candidatus Lambdaproteobacteria bacterium]|nr:hypothetical protein [Candidatus Lambdaproteobacteria bacterium]
MKRIVLAAVVGLLLSRSLALAQERPPLVMEIGFQWTALGTVTGAVVGAAIWLTDPANPNNSLARQTIEGAALGAIAGAGLSIYIMQLTARIPAPVAYGARPLDPARRLNTEPLLAQGPAFGLGGATTVGRSLILPLLDLRF